LEPTEESAGVNVFLRDTPIACYINSLKKLVIQIISKDPHSLALM